jgi:hypothetical protein
MAASILSITTLQLCDSTEFRGRKTTNEKAKIEAGFEFNGNVYSLSIERGYQLEKAIGLLTMMQAPDEYVYEYSDINYIPVDITFSDLKTLYQNGLLYVSNIQGQRSAKMKAIIEATTIEELQAIDLSV